MTTHAEQPAATTPPPPPLSPADAAARRDTSRDGFWNRAETFFLTHFGPLWSLVQAIGPLRRRANGALVDSAIYKAKTRPYPFSTMAPYTSWASLTDRTYTGRHLPPTEIPGGDLPPIDEVVGLFRRAPGKETLSPKSTLLFTYFAQWFTDGFLRTDRKDPLKNNSNHDIDLSPLYGIHANVTEIIRAREGGRLRSQTINGEEYPPYYYRDGQPAPEFRELPIVVPQGEYGYTLPEERKAHLFAWGGDRANVQIGYVMFNTLFLREHNRVAGLLARAHPGWDDERLFQTARNVLIVLLIKIVIEDYINHIKPYYFNFVLAPPIIGDERWYRQNWMTVEFNLLYRWHGLVPNEAEIDGRAIPMVGTLYHNEIVTEHGLGRLFDAASRQPAGMIGLFNSPDFLLPVEKASVELGRLTKLASYNDYREAFGFPRVTAFDQITGDPSRQEALRALYGTVDRIEFYPGLFAEDVRENSAVAALIGRMVGIDAFSQALTNPLLASNIFDEKTFAPEGLRIIESTRSLGEILRRNVPGDGGKYLVTLTRQDWQRS